MKLRILFILTILGLGLSSNLAQAQMGFSTDSTGKLVSEKIGVSRDASGHEFSPAGTSLQEVIKPLCPLAKALMKAGAAIVMLLGIFKMFQGVRQGGGFSGGGLRQGLIMIVLAGALFSLPTLLSLIGLEYLTNRPDNANIWSCLWS